MPPRETSSDFAVIETALQYMSQAELGKLLGVDPRTVRRWLRGETEPRRAYVTAIQAHMDPRLDRSVSSFKFVDLFAGIGGLRRGFDILGGQCVFTSEVDAFARRTYRSNFAGSEAIAGDITDVRSTDVPDHDVLLAGFPCQPFSLAGVSKKNSLGRPHGFKDRAQGTLFFDVIRVLEAKMPAAFLLENVKNLKSHDGGTTYHVITSALREIGYHIYDAVINSDAWVPQRRERVFIVGFRKPVDFSFASLDRPAQSPTLKQVLHHSTEEPEAPYTLRRHGRTVVNPRYTLSDHLWTYLQDYARKHRAKGNGFGYSVFSGDDVARTLSARYHKDGSEILIDRGRGRAPRRLTPRECARLMGFDGPGQSAFAIPVSDTQAYRQFGNAVVVPVVNAIARLVVPRIGEIAGRTGATATAISR